MKQAPNARKSRARNTPRKNGKNNHGHNNGPGNRAEVKVRGNPKQHLEKYKTQAREALQAGDRIMAEYYFQFADHYQRVLNEMRRNNASTNNRTEKTSPQDDGAEKSVNDESTSSNEEGAAVEDKDNEKPRRRPARRSTKKDLGAGDQPREVHPELDLESKAEAVDSESSEENKSADPVTDAEEKPKRSRTLRRRRKPAPVEESGGTSTSDTSESGEAA